MLRPTMKEAAEYYQDLARYFKKRGQVDNARLAYFHSIRSWDEVVKLYPHLLEQYYIARDEFAEFSKTDRTYLNLVAKLKYYLAERPGLRQSDLAVLFKDYKSDLLEQILYCAGKNGEIFETEKGEMYDLKKPPHLYGT